MALVIRTKDETQRFVVAIATAIMLSNRSGFLLLLGFSPHEAHAHTAFFGWIMPTIKTSEITILQIVGLDAAVVGVYSFKPISQH